MSEHLGLIVTLALASGLGVGFLVGWMVGTFYAYRLARRGFPDRKKFGAALFNVAQFLRRLSKDPASDSTMMAEEVDKLRGVIDPPPATLEILK